MNPLRLLERWSAAHPLVADGLVGLALLILTLTMDSGGSAAGWAPLQHTVVTAESAAWMFRRRSPRASATAMALAALAQLLIGPDASPTMVLVPLTVFNISNLFPRRQAAPWAVLGIIGALVWPIRLTVGASWPGAVFAASPGPDSVISYITVTALCLLTILTAWAIGDMMYSRRRLNEATLARANQLEAEATTERALAASDERNRIAREMHDIVAHSLQVIISQADAGRYAGGADPAAATAALTTIASTGRDALAQMRRLLGVLRGPESASTGAPPRIIDIPALLDSVRLTGLPVTFRELGSPHGTLADGAELVIYRVIQESLTNVGRHAGPGASATVTLEWMDSGVRIAVDDDGRGAAADPSTRGTGQGLLGMHERVLLFGGTMDARPRAGGGYAVHAIIPYESA